MDVKNLSGVLSKKIRTIEQVITERKYTKAMWAVAVAGLAISVISNNRAKRKLREELKNKTANVVITIEVPDINKIRIERAE